MRHHFFLPRVIPPHFLRGPHTFYGWYSGYFTTQPWFQSTIISQPWGSHTLQASWAGLPIILPARMMSPCLYTLPTKHPSSTAQLRTPSFLPSIYGKSFKRWVSPSPFSSTDPLRSWMWRWQFSFTTKFTSIFSMGTPLPSFNLNIFGKNSIPGQLALQ